MLMSPLNGVNKELTGRVSLCADRAGGVMAAVSVCNYTLSHCILAAVVGEQAAQPRTRQGGGRREEGGKKIPAPPVLPLCSLDSSSLCPCGSGAVALPCSAPVGRWVGCSCFEDEPLHRPLFSPLKQGDKSRRSPPLRQSRGCGSVPGAGWQRPVGPKRVGQPCSTPRGGTESVLASSRNTRSQLSLWKRQRVPSLGWH